MRIKEKLNDKPVERFQFIADMREGFGYYRTEKGLLGIGLAVHVLLDRLGGARPARDALVHGPRDLHDPGLFVSDHGELGRPHHRRDRPLHLHLSAEEAACDRRHRLFLDRVFERDDALHALCGDDRDELPVGPSGGHLVQHPHVGDAGVPAADDARADQLRPRTAFQHRHDRRLPRRRRRSRSSRGSNYRIILLCAAAVSVSAIFLFPIRMRKAFRAIYNAEGRRT
ncbi:MAG: hypothetical protein MZW92_12735 [Comamonadaceae bacterium]|nr:hypothetical protein [Comamonadaceae bacterium]